MNHAPTTKGFLLIELLIYIGILSLTLVVVIVSMAGFARVYARVEAQQLLARSGADVMERIIREARNAQSVDQAASVLGSHPGSIAFVMPVSPGVTTTSDFFVDAGGISLSENGVTTGSLTQPDVVVEGFVIDHIDTPQSEGVRIQLTLSTSVASSTMTATFYGTAVLRGSYAL